MLRKNVICLLFVMCFISLCNAHQTNETEKSMAVKLIIQKIYNLTSALLLNGTAIEKDKIFKSIKSKLLRSSEALGAKADKYVDLIMRGIKIMARNNNNKNTSHTHNEASKDKKQVPVQRATNDDRVKEMANKMFKLAQEQFRRAKTDEEKKTIIENIKQRLMRSAKQKHDLLHTKHHEIKTYTDLITRGMELMMDKITNKKRRMIMEIVNTKIPTYQDEESKEEDYNKLEQRSNFLDSANVETNKLDTRNEKPTEASRSNPSLTTPFSCEAMFTSTCTEIQSLNQYVCSDSGITLPLNKLCNGISDCSDGSDERNCINEATKLLHRATDITSRIDIYLLRKCFLTEDNSLIIKQNGILNDVLQRQIGFINKYQNINLNNHELGDVYVLKQTLNEVVIVIKTLSVALDSSLCMQYKNKQKAENMARKFIPESVEMLDKHSTNIKISLKSCKCVGSFCTNMTCPEVCKSVCWHRDNLGKWSCQAVDESTRVSLDMVCDGKLDCFDESDESDCNSGVGLTKFKANDIFQNVVQMVQAKSISKEYAAVKSKLLSMQSSIKQLQMEATKSKVDVINIKNARDICYASLFSIYEDILDEASRVPQGFNLDNVHFFLLSVNEQIMTALKHSHTGNDKIITPDGCYCRNGKCALTQCTKGCTRACLIEPRLTKYSCKGTGNNDASVGIDKICNGKADCPNQDDEADCKKEVCRKHHLILLRHIIRDVGEMNKGTAVGEALRSWKTKVISTLKIAENYYNPTRTTIRETINDILHDLVMTYSSLDDTRRTIGYAFDDFFRLSQLVIGAVKSCGL